MASLSYLMIFCSCLFIPSAGQRYLRSPDTHVTSLFIFGDSLFDAGNNNYLKNAAGRANFKPYGETYFKFPTGRFSDGRLIPDFIAEYLKLPLIPPYLQPGNHQLKNGVNFASGGAGALVETYAGGVIDLNTQFRYFMDVKKQLMHTIGISETTKMLSEAIYLFSIGTNDYGAPFLTNSSLLHHFTREEYVGMVVGNLTSVIKGIYKNGGRKFGILSLLDLGYLPSARALEQMNSSIGLGKQTLVLVKLHNKALSKVLKQLKQQLPGFYYSNFDIYTPITQIINNPSKYGFKEVEVACCGSGPYRGVGCGGDGSGNMGANKGYELCENPSEYVFFDGGHPTEMSNHQFAKLMWSGSSKGIYRNGGRKFGLVSSLDLSYLPAVKAFEQMNSSVGFAEQALVLVKLHNQALAKELSQLQEQLPGFKYSFFDIYASTTQRINNPSKFQGSEKGRLWVRTNRGIAEACGGMGGIKEYELCENPKEYIFFDGDHPTDMFKFQQAKLMWSGSSEFTTPYSLQTLIKD